MPVTADELAKSVCGHIGRALDNNECKAVLFDERKNFASHDRPDTTNAVEMAGAAFAYMVVVDDRADARWMNILAGVMEFLAANHRHPPSNARFKDLRTLVLAVPVVESEIRDWFVANY